MAKTNLSQPTWLYNDDNATKPILVAEFHEAPATDHPDPMSFRPSFKVTVELPLAKAGTRSEITYPEPEPTPVEPDPVEEPIPDEEPIPEEDPLP